MADLIMSETERLLGIDAEDYGPADVEALEAVIIDCRQQMLNPNEEPLVADAVYDRLIELLEVCKPESGLLAELWEPDGPITEYTEHLKRHPMMSIQTIKSWDSDEMSDFVERVESVSDEGTSLFFSSKINGHGVRVVYDDGVLVSATSRGRSSAARDITRQLKNVLGETNDSLKSMGLVEIRGELCLDVNKMDEAREFRPGLKSPFSAVSSLVKPSSTAEENKLLTLLAYSMLSDLEGQYQGKDDEYAALEEAGFETPQHTLLELEPGSDVLSAIKSVFTDEFESTIEEYPFFCDGVVVEVNPRGEFYSMGSEGVRNYGNVALKVGVWEQTLYTGIVQAIIWTPGKSKISPVAVVADEPNKAVFDDEGNITNMEDMGVLTKQGNYASRVPLYEPKNILRLEAYPGNPLSLRYGGESGVIPCFMNGALLKEDAVKALFK